MRALILAALGLTGCLKSAAFNCDTSDQCGAGGVCEPEGLCSVADSGCSSGRQFDTSAGAKAGQCVGGGIPTDGPVDMVGGEAIDMAVDQPAGACAGYTALATGGDGDHLYKLISTSTDWSAQNNSQCSPTGGTLAIPNTAAELDGLNTFAAGVDAWVGATDSVSEGDFVDILGASYVMNCAMNCTTGGGIAITGNKMNDDCTMMTSGTNIDIKSCGESHPAICECDPP